MSKLKDILKAVEGHGKYHTSSYDGPVMTVGDGVQQVKVLFKYLIAEASADHADRNKPVAIVKLLKKVDEL